MHLKAPKFWYHNAGIAQQLLQPLSYLYAVGVGLRKQVASSYKADIPVICVGNLVVGGAGKTPSAIAIAQLLLSLGRKVHFLTRGYGGKTQGPLLVDAHQHSAREVGDEALLLAKIAPTWVSADRVSGAKAAQLAGAELLIMDDGMQNPYLHKDIALVVVDGQQGFGNCKVLPAGPLRESIAQGLGRAQGVILVGKDSCDIKSTLGQLPILKCQIVPDQDSIAAVEGKRLWAFAGLGFPEKFFAMLESQGGRLIERVIFPDHYQYLEDDLQKLVADAKKHNATLVTTAKDLAKIPEKFHPSILEFRINMQFDDPSLLKAILGTVAS